MQAPHIFFSWDKWDNWGNPEKCICFHTIDPSFISSSWDDILYVNRIWGHPITTLRHIFVVHAQLHGRKKFHNFHLQELSLCFFQRQLLWYGARVCRCTLSEYFSVHTCEQIGSLLNLHKEMTRQKIFIFLFASKKNSIFYNVRKLVAKLIWVASFHKLDAIINDTCTTRPKRIKIE